MQKNTNAISLVGIKQKLNVLILENSTHVTGALKGVCNIAVDMRDEIDFVFVVPKKEAPIKTIHEYQFQKIYGINLFELNRQVTSALLYLPRLVINTIKVRRIVATEKIDLIHNNDLYNLIPPMLKMVGSKVPYICFVRFLPNRFPSWIFKFWLNVHLRFATKIVVVSEYLKTQLPAAEKIICIYDKMPNSEKYPERQNDSTSVKTFLYLSNIIVGKGLNIAIEAFAKIHHDNPDWRLRMVGGDMGLEKNQQYKIELQELTKRLGIENKVEWVGFSTDVEREYKCADIALNFSDSESLSITCIDALFFGCPMIATRSGGPSEIIEDGVSGLLVPVNDIDRIAAAMQLLINDPAKRKSFSIQGRKSVREKFSTEKTSMRLKSIYQEQFLER